MEQKFINVLSLLIPNRSKKGSDFLYINSSEDVEKLNNRQRRKQASDFSVINAQNVINKNGKFYGWYRLSDGDDKRFNYTNAIGPDGNKGVFGNNFVYCGLAPCVNIKIPNINNLRKYENNFSKMNSFISKLKREMPIIKLGAYPQSYVKAEEADFLESCFNKGLLKNGMKATGRFYSCNGDFYAKNNYSEKKCPEFEINGKRYVRYHSKNCVLNINERTFTSDNTAWFKVEPVEFIVKNWSRMPKYINPSGSEEDFEFILQTKNIIFSGIAFGKNSYKHSFVRNFMNETLLNEVFNPERLANNIIVISKNITDIASNAYEGCTSLNEVIIHNNIKKIGEGAFKYCNFNYAFNDKIKNQLILTKEKPKDFTNYNNFINFSKMFKHLSGSDYDSVLDYYVKKDYSKVNNYAKMVEKLSNANIIIPYKFIKKLEDSKLFDNFVKNDFRFLKNEIQNINELLESYPEEFRISFYDFATAFGCFEHSPVLDKNGKPTDYLIAQKACSVLAQLLKSNKLDIEKIHYLLSASNSLLNYNSKTSQEFIKFISIKGKDGNFENLQMLLDLEEEERGSFVNAINRFSTALLMRKQPSLEDGIKKLSWKEIFIKLKTEFEFENVTDESWIIAKLFTDMNINDQYLFDKAKSIHESAKASGIKSHILDVSLKEKTIQQSIEEIKKDTQNELKISRDLIEDLYNKGFTYEFLDKHDPKNLILGLYCDCCAVIGNSFYGAKIAEQSVIAPDVQNLIIKNAKGDIVAKAAMYVNKSHGYIVFNDIEINLKFRKNEIKPGYYKDYDLSDASKSREEIFGAFMRGLHDFIKEYDKENPEKPIRMATVGNGYNRLKQQCARFKIATKNLKVPYEYNFADAMEENQYILYENTKIKYDKKTEEEIFEWKN